MQIFGFSNELQIIMYECKYGDWYFENEVYFKKFLSLKQGDMIVDAYEYQFSKMQYLYHLEEDETHDLNSFLRGLRLNI